MLHKKFTYQLKLLFNAFSSLTNFVDYNEQITWVEQVLSEFLNIVWEGCGEHHRLQFHEFTLLGFTFFSLKRIHFYTQTENMVI